VYVKTWGTWVNALEKMVGYENTLGWVGSEGPDAKNVISVRHFNNGIPLNETPITETMTVFSKFTRQNFDEKKNRSPHFSLSSS